MSHTPRPWKIERHYDSGYKNISAQKHTALAQVVWCMEDEDRSPECEANAYLIAAAPDLLEALQWYAELAKEMYYTGGSSGVWELCEDRGRRAKEAIAKATGVLAEGDSKDS